jgi:hypothetical protein
MDLTFIGAFVDMTDITVEMVNIARITTVPNMKAIMAITGFKIIKPSSKP